MKHVNPWLKGTLDFGPIILFFAGYHFVKGRHFTIAGHDYNGFIVMAAAFAVLTFITTLALWKLTGKLARMQIVTLVIIVIMTGFTLWFNDERFFKMKPTLIYAFFAGVLGFGLLRGQSYLRFVMEEALPLQPEGWMVLTRRIAGFFAVLAVLNEIVWRNFSTEIWVDFKTFGLTFAIFGFFLTQASVFERYGIYPEDEDRPEEDGVTAEAEKEAP